MKKQIVILTFEKSTKNTHKYTEVAADGKPPIIDHLYIKKWVLPGTPPQQLSVTIDEHPIFI